MSEHAARTLRPEDEIAHYRIVSPLGAGGMGEVYLAQDRTLGRNVALKVLPPDLVRNEDRVRRFELEARSASQLSHPNIVTIYEIGRDTVRSAGGLDSDPVHYISMELVSGKTLASLIHEDRTDLRTLLGYLAQAAEGLAKAHAAGIVHRDLKPGNIMVSADGFTKVLDFGLAKLTEQRDGGPGSADTPKTAVDTSAAGSVIGTTGYMSPEQVAGRPVDPRSDIFSFGCVLYEATTRRKPFVAATAVETMHKILNEKPAPVEELNDKAPAELRRLIRRCLAKSPDQRVQSIKDLAIELREIVEEYDALSASASSASSVAGAAAGTPARSLPRFAVAALAVVALGGIALGVWGVLRGGSREEQPQPFQQMRMSTQTSRGDVLEAALSRDGRYLVYVAGRSGRTSLRVRQVATGSDVEVLPEGDAGLEGPAFSPDGNYVFYLARKPENRQYRALFEVPSLGGAPRERVFDVDSRVTFAPDGKRIGFWRGVPQKRETLLVVFDLESARERVLATLPNAEIDQSALAWSPDGAVLAALGLQPPPALGTDIVFFDAETGTRRRFLELPRTFLVSIAWTADGRGLVAAGSDLQTFQAQVYLIDHPGGRLQRVTNDFHNYHGVSVSGGEEAIAAARTTRLANLWVADAAGGSAARQITSVTSPEASPGNFSVAGADQVVFDMPRDRTLHIWTIAAGGGEVRPLTAGTTHSANPRGAPGVIVFDRLADMAANVWRMAPDGSGARQLTTGTGEQCRALSPDGRFLAFERWDAEGTIHALALETGETSRVIEGATNVLAFTLDGSHLLVNQFEPDSSGLSRSVLRLVPIAGGPATATFRMPAAAIGATVGPDGRSVTLRSRSDPAWNVYRLRAEGGEPTQVTRFREGRLMGHWWSPDGARLAVSVRTRAGDSIWVTDADGGRPLQAAQFAAADVFNVRWFPDSRRLAVSAGTINRDAVLIRSFR